MKKLKTILNSNYFYVVIFIILLLYIFLFTKIIKYHSNYNNNDIKLVGKILDYNIDGDKLSLIVLGKEKVQATYYIKRENEKNYLEKELLVGSEIKLVGKYSDPSNNTIPNTFNYKKYLYNKKIYKLFTIDTYELSNVINLIYKLKNIVKRRINKSEVASYLNTFILGDKRELNNDVYKNYQKCGISHLFAISGMHISLFSFMLYKLLKLFKLNDRKTFLIVTLMLWLYAFLTGFPASILRALVFMMILNLNNLYNLKLSNIKCLLITIFLILIFSPFMIYDLGFQYSILTVSGILLHSNFIKGNYFVKLLKTSLIAFIYSAPLTIYNFNEINILSLFINLFFVPLVSFIIYPFLLLTFILPFLSHIAKLLIYLMEWLNNFFAMINIFIINYPKTISILIILIYLLLIGYALTKRKLFLVLLVVILLFGKFKPIIDKNTYVYFFDVGQGDSMLIVSPYQKKVVMIDTGGVVTFGYKEIWQTKTKTYFKSYNIILFLKSIGITKINYLLLSHGDYDHMGEAINLVENFKVEKVIFNCGEFNELEQDLIKALDKKKIPYYSCIKELNIDDNKLYFLNNKDYGNENDNSSVIYTELNNHKFLFMGDAGIEVEEDLIEKYNLQDIDVLKVGHHGSKTSSSKSFIDEINPKYSIISVGKNNRYGHPNKEVLENLNNSKVYRADEDGSIMFKIKNNKLHIKTCSP